ncbi:NUDIX hydrolase [Comamonas kerstersii]|uniref:NUDIX hydrolase n=1 Tax=Comamonas kerstersii TaxID=225992 RepID=UPI00266DA675|nr:hypothetical protein [Comamonas kerstersii]
MNATPTQALHAELVAVLVAVSQGAPRVLTTQCGQALPAGPFQMVHRSLQAGLRAWVESQTQHSLGYVEQLYTFADREREEAAHVLSISYLGLTCEPEQSPQGATSWQDWYSFFPWEDWRQGAPAVLQSCILPHLQAWVDEAQNQALRHTRQARVAINFGINGQAWNEELVLQRYELLFEAGLIEEAARRGLPMRGQVPGKAMAHDHRRILATGMARLRAKIKYRPVVFELMPPEFTLLQLQQTVEALAGRGLHKQNFRRLIEQQALVEETGQMTAGSAGRPAKLFRFRSDVLQERATAGTKLPLARGA